MTIIRRMIFLRTPLDFLDYGGGSATGSTVIILIKFILNLDLVYQYDTIKQTNSQVNVADYSVIHIKIIKPIK